MQEISFYQTHLDRVSRSFALCIQKLTPAMRHWTSLSYLLCRALDTIEDSTWASSELQEIQYFEFENFIQTLPDRARVQKWALAFPDLIPSGEKELLKDTYLLLD